MARLCIGLVKQHTHTGFVKTGKTNAHMALTSSLRGLRRKTIDTTMRPAYAGRVVYGGKYDQINTISQL